MEKREKLNFSTNAKLGKLVGRNLWTNMDILPENTEICLKRRDKPAGAE